MPVCRVLCFVATLTCCGAPRTERARVHDQPNAFAEPRDPRLDASVPTANAVESDDAVPSDAALDAPVGAQPPVVGRKRITFIHGAGGARDPAKVDEARRGCDSGDVARCHALGLSLMTPGDPDSPNNRDAVAAFDKGCTGGYAPSCNGLGVMYASGLGVPLDEAKAVALQTKACHDGSETGCVHVAMAYESGRGVTASEGEAAAFYERACKLGSKPYCKKTKATSRK